MTDTDEARRLLAAATYSTLRAATPLDRLEQENQG